MSLVEIITFKASEANQFGPAWVGNIVVDLPRIGTRKAGRQTLPIVFSGATEEIVRERAKAFYEAEQAKFKAREANARKLAQRNAERSAKNDDQDQAS
jgi:hypothetical protein